MAEPRVGVVVVSYETRQELRRCLASLADVPVETVVVDNASTDGSADLVAREFPGTTLVRSATNEGFARASNRGAAVARAPYLLFLNSDAALEPGALAILAGVLDADPRTAAVGPRTRNDDGTPQVSFGPALTPLAEWRQRRLVRGVRRRDPRVLAQVEALSSRAAEPDWVSGACLLVRRDAFAQVGGFDEAFFLYEEDVDLCVRLRAAGWRVRFEPRAVAVHRLGRSMERLPDRARLEYHRSHLRYYGKHNGALDRTLLRAGLVLRSVAGWLGRAARGDAAGRRAHAAVLRLALVGPS